MNIVEFPLDKFFKNLKLRSIFRAFSRGFVVAEEEIEIILYMTDGLPCILADDYIRELIKLLPRNMKINYTKKEVDSLEEFNELAKKFNIDGLPFIIIRKGGKEYRISGFDPPEIEKALFGKVMFSKDKHHKGIC